MPRTARIHIANIPLHVVQRGHDKCACFLTEQAFELYSGLLAEFAPKTGCNIHAYVLMPNHVHLLLTSEQAMGCTQLMRSVNQRYSQWVNRKTGRIGTLWQGRFWSSPVDTATYLFTCYRYIELNPVRAALVDHASKYPWSSYRSNACGEASLFVRPHAMYNELGSNADARRTVYSGLFSADLGPAEVQAIRAAIRGGLPLGSDTFIAEMESITGRRLRKRRPGPHAAEGEKEPDMDGSDR